MNADALAQQVRKLRRARGISQQVMAAHLGLSRATLSAFESGRGRDLGLQKLIAMLDYLGCELTVREKSAWPSFEELRDGG